MGGGRRRGRGRWSDGGAGIGRRTETGIGIGGGTGGMEKGMDGPPPPFPRNGDALLEVDQGRGTGSEGGMEVVGGVVVLALLTPHLPRSVDEAVAEAGAERGRGYGANGGMMVTTGA